jgi:hypothetical protein
MAGGYMGRLLFVNLATRKINDWNPGALDWGQVSNKPSRKKLQELGLDEISLRSSGLRIK